MIQTQLRRPAIKDVIPFFNGTIQEFFDAFVTSDGSTVTMSVERSGGGDLTQRFSTGREIFDCTPPATIPLSPGTDEVPEFNYVYILRSAPGVLVVDNEDWPDAEHIRIGFFYVPSASLVNTGSPGHDFIYANRNVNNELAGANGQGHLQHLMEKLRHLGSSWHDGVEGVATQDGNNLWVSVSEGNISQIHHHIFEAMDSDTDGPGDPILVINDPDANYAIVHSLNENTKYAGGSSFGTSKYVKYILWGAANKTGAVSLMCLNLPDLPLSGEYNSAANALRDVDGAANFTIPRAFTHEGGVAFLIAAFICQHTATGMILQQTVDLRGESPMTASGSGTGGGDVSADAVLVDGAVVVGDGGAKGVKTVPVLMDGAGNISAVETLTLASDIIHTGDADTMVRFSTNQVSVEAGGLEFVHFKKAAARKTEFNVANVDIDFIVNADGAPDFLFIDAGTKKMTIGSSTGFGLFGIDGRADEVQLTIQGHSTQASDILLIEKEDGTDLLTLDNSGKLTVIGTGTVIDVQNTTDAESNLVGVFRGGNRATAASLDNAYLEFRLDDNIGNQQVAGLMMWQHTTVTAGSVDGVFRFFTSLNGEPKEIMAFGFLTAGNGVIQMNTAQEDVDLAVLTPNNSFTFGVDGGFETVYIGAKIKTDEAQLIIDGFQDKIQLLIEGHSTQNQDLLVLRTSAEADVLKVNNSGDMSLEGTMGIVGNIPTSHTALNASIGSANISRSFYSKLQYGPVTGVLVSGAWFESQHVTSVPNTIIYGVTGIAERANDASGTQDSFGSRGLAGVKAGQVITQGTHTHSGVYGKATGANANATGGDFIRASIHGATPGAIAGSPTSDVSYAGLFDAAVLIDGARDEVQLTVQGYSTQNENLQEWKQSDGTVVGAIDNDGNLTIGSGAAGIDPTLTFIGGADSGVMKWAEGEDYFEFADDLLMVGDRKVFFNSIDDFIHSRSSGNLTLNANSDLQLRVLGFTKLLITSVLATFDTDVLVATGNDFTVVSGEAKGFFDTFMGEGAAISNSKYLEYGQSLFTATRGFVMPYAGSIVSIGASATVVGSIGGSWDLQTRIGGATSLGVIMATATNGDKNVRATAARGVHTFRAGDVLSFFANEIAGSSTLTDIVVHCRVQYDN